jgi:hypothetical protein
MKSVGPFLSSGARNGTAAALSAITLGKSTPCATKKMAEAQKLTLSSHLAIATLFYMKEITHKVPR